jgi:hypothetical protein
MCSPGIGMRQYLQQETARQEGHIAMHFSCNDPWYVFDSMIWENKLTRAISTKPIQIWFISELSREFLGRFARFKRSGGPINREIYSITFVFWKCHRVWTERLRISSKSNNPQWETEPAKRIFLVYPSLPWSSILVTLCAKKWYRWQDKDDLMDRAMLLKTVYPTVERHWIFMRFIPFPFRPCSPMNFNLKNSENSHHKGNDTIVFHGHIRA